jgi:endonuclease/exonuclease/phosphatase family metal-dependent hydrolase
LAIDHIYHSPLFAASRFKTVDSKASDHRPVVTELEWAAD